MNYLEKITLYANKCPLYVYGLLFGGLSALGFSPVNLWSVALIAFAFFMAPLFFTPEKFKSRKSYFFYGWWFGLGHFVGGLYWISIALLVEERFYFVFPFALFALPSILACYMGLVCWLFSYFKPLSLLHRIVVFATIWVLIEYARSVLLTGFPWNLISHIWTNHLEVLQALSVIGGYGLGWLTILMAGCVMMIFQKQKVVFYSTTLCLVFVGLHMFGAYRLSLEELQTKNTETKILLVQPNVAQKDKWRSEVMAKNLQPLVESLSQPEESHPDLIIWPETAITTNYVNLDKAFLKLIGSKLKRGHLISGGLKMRYVTENFKSNRKRWNSVFVINADGEIVESYDKSHLVPFGEYVPWSSYLSFLSILPDDFGFSTGPGMRSVTTDSIPAFSPLICYEAIFPNAVIDEHDRPKWLLHLTNDAWYGKSSGPYQHFNIARMRAIEEGLPLVRVANTGISAIVDPLGRIIAMTQLQEEKSISSYLPEALEHKTYYAEYYHLAFYVFCLIFSLYTFYVILVYSRSRSLLPNKQKFKNKRG